MGSEKKPDRVRKTEHTDYKTPGIEQQDTSGTPYPVIGSLSTGSIEVTGKSPWPHFKADSQGPKGAIATTDEVARYIIWHAKNNTVPMNNLKLQMLLYYAQGWHLALYGKKLFSKPIEAWVHGPVVKSIYSKYKNMFKDDCFIGKDGNIQLPRFTNKSQKHLPGFFDNLFEVFMHLDAFVLERMTHNEPPWIEARGGIGPDEISEREVSCDTMKLYFKSLMKK
ncbi:MAG: DUF4065 domain-containing protein [Planctomycetota bacterium]|nr:MAG: DUF4065 domain-containing protein [Planctomycetota bacterium]